MGAVVSVDGRITDEHHATISVFDHGFLYGEGVYETLRTYHKRPFLYEPHVRRLRASAAQLALPVPFSDAELASRMQATVDAHGELDEAYIRVLLTRGVGELSYDPATCANPTLVIIVKPHRDPPATHFEDGVKVSLVSVVRNYSGSVNPRIKSNNLLNNALAMQEALTRGASEALMRNVTGEVVECSQSNFFVVKDGRVLTPALECGLLAGVTRQFLFEIAADLDLPMSEARLHDADVVGADEAFLTSTTREVTPVVLVDEHRIGAGTPGPITRRLLQEYRRRADRMCSATVGA
ncbi:MAG: aminotransferase class IV [Vicinamibacterales bacterium]